MQVNFRFGSILFIANPLGRVHLTLESLPVLATCSTIWWSPSTTVFALLCFPLSSHGFSFHLSCGIYAGGMIWVTIALNVNITFFIYLRFVCRYSVFLPIHKFHLCLLVSIASVFVRLCSTPTPKCAFCCTRSYQLNNDNLLRQLLLLRAQ